MQGAPQTKKDRDALRIAMWISLLVGFLMLGIKVGAYIITHSTAILSDAAESVVHVAAVGFAAYSLHFAFKPPDESHTYGHAKISFFSAGFEGAMIIIAALYIIYEAVMRWITGLYLERLGIGTALTALAVVINGILGYHLVRLGRNKHSIIVEANGKHVLTDCWTSIGVLVGLGLTIVTGWLPFDPIFAILVASNILISGGRLLRDSIGGLMDAADPELHEQLVSILDKETKRRGITYHNLRHRGLGYGHRVEVHLLFNRNTSIQTAHSMATEIERVIEGQLSPGTDVTTHLESLEDHDEAHANHPSV
ncbi:MAG: cation diffusion facilitator family transporter [Verrucomicrobia bacterium]|nr:cation diffusion facilitator family transporter [Verrucomicrobiota bacterium]